MKNMLISLLYIMFYQLVPAQSNTVRIHFSEMKFEQLQLVFHVTTDYNTKVYFQGQSDNGADWSFVIPDSVNETCSPPTFVLPEINDSLVESIAFTTELDGDTLFTAGTYFDINADIKSTYYKTVEFHNQPYMVDPEKHIVRLKTIKQYRFLISPGADRQIISSMEAMNNGYLMVNTVNNSIYQKQMDTFERLTLKYPDSYFMAYFFQGNFNLLKSKKDIQRIYNCFSDEIKTSKYGKKIADFLVSKNTKYEFNKFENGSLPIWPSGEEELIVQDTSVFNLLLFSASWCAPCRAEIPLLKEIYTNYKDHLVMNYISMDEELTINNWRDLMENEQIPWRCLMAKDDIDEITDKYFVEGIPYNILVYPGGIKAEILDIRDAKDYQKLVEMMQ